MSSEETTDDGADVTEVVEAPREGVIAGVLLLLLLAAPPDPCAGAIVGNLPGGVVAVFDGVAASTDPAGTNAGADLLFPLLGTTIAAAAVATVVGLTPEPLGVVRDLGGLKVAAGFAVVGVVCAAAGAAILAGVEVAAAAGEAAASAAAAADGPFSALTGGVDLKVFGRSGGCGGFVTWELTSIFMTCAST